MRRIASGPEFLPHDPGMPPLGLQVDGHARGARAVGLSSFGGALLTLWALGEGVQRPRALLWLLVLAAVLGLRAWLAQGCLHGDRLQRLGAARTLGQLRWLSLLHGAVWGSLPLLVPWPWQTEQLEMMVMATGSAVVAGAAVSLMYDTRAALAFALPAALPLALLLAAVPGPWPRAVSVALVMVGVLACTLVAAARSVRRGMVMMSHAQAVEAERLRRAGDREDLLRQVFDHIGEGLCLFDAGQRLVAWNARMVSLMGLDPSQVRPGAPLRDLLLAMGRLGEFGPVDPEAEADRRLAAMTRTGGELARHQRPDGSTIETRRSPMPDGGFTLLAVDISERRASERALVRNRNMLTLLLESTEEGVWFIDNDQLTTDANPAMCRMLGVSRDQILGRSIFDFVDAENAAIFRDQVRRRSQGLPGSYEIALRRSDGQLVHCQNNPTPLFDDRGVKIGAVGLFSDITAHKQAAAELNRAGELLTAKSRLLESTLESLSQGVMSIGADGRIEAWNRRVLELTEVPESLLQSHPTLREMVAWQLAHGVLGPTDTPRSEAWVDEAQRLVAGEASLLWETLRYQRQRRDGAVIEVQLHRAPGGAQVRTYSDVTESARAQRALRASETRFRTMADAAPAFIWQSNADGQALWFNQAWLRALGCTLEEAQRQNWVDRIVAEDYAACNERFRAALRARAPFEIEFRVRTADGHELWIEDHGIPLQDADGALEGYVTYGWDITSRKAAERSLIAARDDAERANRAKSDFLSRMSHELRTPLNAVLGFAQLIEREPAEPLQPLQRERVHQILRGGAHLLDLINEVLDLARIESGALSMQVEAVAVDALVRDCLRLVEPAALQAGVRLDPAPPGPQPGTVFTDATRLRQVLLNLLSNAIKYNRPGGRVAVVALDLGPRVRLEVSDTGRGLSAEQQQRLFQAFDRLGAEHGAVEGTGIGLSLSKALVDLMGGRIGARSVPGQGSTFWVELPRGAAPVIDAARVRPRPEALAPSDAPLPCGPQRRVLYIEDNSVNQIVVESMLQRLPGVQVLLASDPEQGLQMAFEQPPDLVLLDIQLPGMSGYEVLTRLRAQATTAAVPVIAVTANAMPEDLERARDAGFDDYVTKPLELERLLSAVSAQLPPA